MIFSRGRETGAKGSGAAAAATASAIGFFIQKNLCEGDTRFA